MENIKIPLSAFCLRYFLDLEIVNGCYILTADYLNNLMVSSTKEKIYIKEVKKMCKKYHVSFNPVYGFGITKFYIMEV